MYEPTAGDKLGNRLEVVGKRERGDAFKAVFGRDGEDSVGNFSRALRHVLVQIGSPLPRAFGRVGACRPERLRAFGIDAVLVEKTLLMVEG